MVILAFPDKGDTEALLRQNYGPDLNVPETALYESEDSAEPEASTKKGKKKSTCSTF
jgi:hypothetical protein